MNWISNYVRPRVNSLFSRRETPENLWSKCPECGTMLFHRELAEALNVCTNCGHHMNITPRERFQALFDGGVFAPIDVPAPKADPLGFRDQKRYPDRLKAAQKETGQKEAMLVALGEIGHTKVVAAAQDFSFMAGSMGMGVGNAIIAACERAVKEKCPLILFSAAGGARMQEGILSLMQMPRSVVAVEVVQGGRPALYRGADPSDHRRGDRLLCDAGRCAYRRAERAHLLCGPAGDRADHPREAARGLPARRVPAGPRHAGPGDPAHRSARRS